MITMRKMMIAKTYGSAAINYRNLKMNVTRVFCKQVITYKHWYHNVLWFPTGGGHTIIDSMSTQNVASTIIQNYMSQLGAHIICSIIVIGHKTNCNFNRTYFRKRLVQCGSGHSLFFYVHTYTTHCQIEMIHMTETVFMVGTQDIARTSFKQAYFLIAWLRPIKLYGAVKDTSLFNTFLQRGPTYLLYTKKGPWLLFCLWMFGFSFLFRCLTIKTSTFGKMVPTIVTYLG